MNALVSICNRTRRSTPRLNYNEVAQAIVPGWEISLAFVGEVTARKLNRVLRDKTYIPNVLSYSVGKKHGEIIICLTEAKKQAPRYDLPYTSFILFLFIHGCLHLKGHQHSVTMERREQTLLAKFAKGGAHDSQSHSKTNGTTHNYRH